MAAYAPCIKSVSIGNRRKHGIAAAAKKRISLWHGSENGEIERHLVAKMKHENVCARVSIIIGGSSSSIAAGIIVSGIWLVSNCVYGGVACYQRIVSVMARNIVMAAASCGGVNERNMLAYAASSAAASVTAASLKRKKQSAAAASSYRIVRIKQHGIGSGEAAIIEMASWRHKASSSVWHQHGV